MIAIQTQRTLLRSPTTPTTPKVRRALDSASLTSIPRPNWANVADLVSELEKPSGAGLAQLGERLLATQNAEGGWGEKPGAQADLDSSVLHHVALAAWMRRQQHARVYPDRYSQGDLESLLPGPELHSKLQSALQKSWSYLSAQTPLKGDRALEALPKRVLSKVQQAPAQLHEALLGSELATRLDPKGSVQNALATLESALTGSPQEARQLPSTAKKLWTTGGLASAGLVVGLVLTGGVVAQLMAGAAAGWLVASMVESVVHDKVAHCKDLPGSRPDSSRRSLVGQVAAHGPEWLARKLENSWFGHTKIHHYRTFIKDHVSQFRDPQDRQKLDQYLAKHGREDLIEEEYGNTIRAKGYLMFQAVASPAYATAVAAASLLGAGPVFALGFAIPVAAYPLFSKEFHRYTHMPAAEALSKASAPMGAFLKTPLARFIVRHHFMHHVDDNTNFNLMPGADFLRGKAVKPGVAHLEELRRLGVLF